MDSEVEELWTAAKSAIILSLGDFTYNAILFLSYIVTLRLLGSEGYGLYNLVVSIPLQILSFISLSIDTAISRYTRFYLAKNMVEEVKNVLKVTLFIKILSGVVATIICFLFANQLATLIINRPDAYSYIRFASIIALLNNLYTYLLSVFIGFEEVWRNSVLKVIYSVSKTVLAIPLLLMGFYIIGALASYILSLYIAIAIGFVFLVTSIKQRFSQKVVKKDSISKVLAKEVVKYSAPLHISTLLSTILSVYQTIILSRTLTDAEIGGYRALLVFQTFITVVSAPISISLLPMYTNINAKGDRESLAKAFSKSNKYIALIILPLSTAIMVFSRELVYIICGADYVFASVYLPLLFAPNLLAGLGSIAIPQLLNAVGKTNFNLYASLTSTIVFIPTSYLLTIVLGQRLWGFLASSLIASVIGLATMAFFGVRLLGKFLEFKDVLPIYASSALAVVPTILFYYVPFPRPTSVIRIAVGGLTYILIYIVINVLLKGLKEQDVDFFEKAFKGIPVLNMVIKLLASITRKLLHILGNS